MREVKIIFGNKHQLIDDHGNNKHKWTTFVKFADKKLSAVKLLQKVRYGLHETFGSEYLDVMGSNQNKNFEMTMHGWGTFDIPITLFLRFRLKNGLKQVSVNHHLCFDGNGSSKQLVLMLDEQ